MTDSITLLHEAAARLEAGQALAREELSKHIGDDDHNQAIFTRTLDKVATSIDNLTLLIGKESEDGKGGTGMVGQIKQLVIAKERSDRWINMISGGFAVMTISVTVFWWLVKAKLDAFFHGN